jgi:uncharacterized protein YcfJ
MTIKIRTLILSLAGMAILVSGCVNPDGPQNNTVTGAIIGGAYGALSGAAIGGRNGGSEALIGAAVGALAGSLIGNYADQQQAVHIMAETQAARITEETQAIRITAETPVTYAPMPPPVATPKPLTIADVKALAKAGVTADVMIAQIRDSQTVFHLDATAIIDLREAGIPDKVVNFMINTPTTVSTATQTPPSAADVVAAAPAPNYVWVAGEWVWNDTGWVWVDAHWEYPPHPGAVWIAGHSWKDDHGWHNERGHWQ